MTSVATIIGIDCSADPTKVGLARAWIEDGRVRVAEARRGRNEASIVSVVQEWITTSSTALLALDAPLGWPAAFGTALVHHRAGESLPNRANELFQRDTDRFIKARLGKKPLDVGADRIARTALAALGLLRQIAAAVGKGVPLAWRHSVLPALSAIEVYPAATLIAHAGGGTAGRRPADWLSSLSHHIAQDFEVETACAASDHVRDAVVCVLAGVDFVRGQALAPQNEEVARREGWIWVRDPDLPCTCRA